MELRDREEGERSEGFLVKANEVCKIANSTFVKCLFISFPLVSVSV